MKLFFYYTEKVFCPLQNVHPKSWDVRCKSWNIHPKPWDIRCKPWDIKFAEGKKLFFWEKKTFSAQCFKKRKSGFLFNGKNLFPQQGEGGHGFVIVQIAYHSVGGTDVDTRHVGIGKKGEYGMVCLRRIGHGQILFLPEAGNAFLVLFTGYADEAEVLFIGKMPVKGIYTGKFLLAVATLGVEEHYHGEIAQEGVARQAAAISSRDRKTRQGIAHLYACAFTIARWYALFSNAGGTQKE